MKVMSNLQGRPVRVAVLVAMIAVLALFVSTFGGAFIARAQAQDGAMSDPTLTSDTPGAVVVSWTIPSPTPSDYRIDWAKSGKSYNSWKVNEGHVYPAGTKTTVTISGLDSGVGYKVRMRARYNAGDYADSPWSGPWTGNATITVAAEPESSESQEESSPSPTPTCHSHSHSYSHSHSHS